jgi:hypothetical protein
MVSSQSLSVRLHFYENLVLIHPMKNEKEDKAIRKSKPNWVEPSEIRSKSIADRCRNTPKINHFTN